MLHLLRSSRAVRMSIDIIRTFVRLRQLIEDMLRMAQARENKRQ
jgi:hypothetical protein